MKARILTLEEWELRRGPEMPAPLTGTDPRDVAVVVIEDAEGAIVACMTVAKITHFEGLWIDPKHRGNPGVVRPLLDQAWALPRARGERWAIGAAANGDDRMRDFLERRGGVLMPVEFFALPVGEKDQCPQQ